MTERQKSDIRLLRERGKKYGEVAETLGLSLAAVKKFCQRNGLTDEKLGRQQAQAALPADADDDGKHCRNCGGELPKGRRAFCSEACRSAWWKEHPEKIRKRKVSALRCQGCGKLFLDYKYRSRKYCSHKCYVKSRFGAPEERRKSGRKKAGEELVPVIILSKSSGTIMVPADRIAALLGGETS